MILYNTKQFSRIVYCKKHPHALFLFFKLINKDRISLCKIFFFRNRIFCPSYLNLDLIDLKLGYAT